MDSSPRVCRKLPRASSVALVVMLFAAAPALATVYKEIGGDDLEINPMTPLRSSNTSLDIADNGDIYIASEWTSFTAGQAIFVYRSPDHGATWMLWGQLIDPDPSHGYRHPCLRIAEGSENRLYLACQYDPGAGNTRIRVAYSPLGGATASWTQVDVMSTSGVDYSWPSIDSDASTTAAYTLFVAAQSSGADGDDIRLTRSTTFGASWAAPYIIALANTNDRDNRVPQIRYGTAGFVHCTWTTFARFGSSIDDAVNYRRAQNRAASVFDWQAPIAIAPDNNARDEWYPTIAASHANGRVELAYRVALPRSNVPLDSEVRGSTDYGVTWPSVSILDGIYAPELDVRPGLGAFVCLGQRGTDNYGFMTAANVTPFIWSPHQSLMDGSHLDPYDAPPGRHHAWSAVDGGSALVWTRREVPPGLVDSLLFDATWRGDPGNPILAPGFPVTLPCNIDRATAIVELDGDPQSEIVFAGAYGMVCAINHDGTMLPGFPVALPAGVPPDTIPGNLAAGFLQSGPFPQLVVGSTTGEVFALRADGSTVPNWPVDLGTGAATYVAIGRILTSGQQVAACSGNHLFLLMANGSVAPGFPVTLPSVTTSAPAIGDIDGDGDDEMVVLVGSVMDVIRGNGSIQAARVLIGRQLRNASSLADLNLDGDLEIVFGTDLGEVYVLNPNGSNVAPWPYLDPTGDPIAGAALGQMSGSPEPEVVFPTVDASGTLVHAFSLNKTELPGYPARLTASSLNEPKIDAIDGYPPEVILDADSVFSWNNAGARTSGWPRDVYGGPWNVMTGDIDHDGNVEVVATSYNQLFVFDTNAPVYRSLLSPTAWWPMYGYNAARQHCLACGPGAVTGVSQPTTGHVRLDPPRPNPGSGPVAIHFVLPAAGAVRLRVFDTSGRACRELERREISAGGHDLSWDPRAKGSDPLAPGVYFLRLEVASPAGAETLTRKLVIVGS